jgi:hypothetical protein
MKELVNQIQEEILQDKYIIEFSEGDCSICLKNQKGYRVAFDSDYKSAVR